MSAAFSRRAAMAREPRLRRRSRHGACQYDPEIAAPGRVALVLQEMETARALGIADMKAARRDVQITTGSTKSPGDVDTDHNGVISMEDSPPTSRGACRI